MVIIYFLLRAIAVIFVLWLIYKTFRAAFRSADVSEQVEKYHDTVAAGKLAQESGVDAEEYARAKESLESLNKTVNQ